MANLCYEGSCYNEVAVFMLSNLGMIYLRDSDSLSSFQTLHHPHLAQS